MSPRVWFRTARALLGPPRWWRALRAPGPLWVAVVASPVIALAVRIPFTAWAAGAVTGMAYCWIVDALFDRGES